MEPHHTRGKKVPALGLSHAETTPLRIAYGIHERTTHQYASRQFMERAQIQHTQQHEDESKSTRVNKDMAMTRCAGLRRSSAVLQAELICPVQM